MKKMTWILKHRIKSWFSFFPWITQKEKAIPSDKTLTYIMSSLLILNCFEYLDLTEAESLLYASGFEIDRNTLIIDRLVQVDMAMQNSCYVNAETRSSHQALVKMEKYGQRLFGLFHIHPGNGEGAAFPSMLDLMTMDKFETAGYQTIGAVFSRDGWIRFFSTNNKKYKVKVIGTGVEQYDNKTFKLTEINHV